jgi:hypothetical protein
MKTKATNPHPKNPRSTSLCHLSKIILLGTVVAVASAVGCSSNHPPKTLSATPSATVQTAALKTVAAPAAQPVAVSAKTTRRVSVEAKPPASKLITYRSRDYGISFDYPWQYAYVSARTMGRGDETTANAVDDGQLMLARIEVPKGFYPDTDLESGSFNVSLNQSLDEDACYATLGSAKAGEMGMETINAVPFRWAESDEGGRGKAMKQRTYVAFANDTCYQLQMVVKTSNEGGLAREIDPDQVLRRLDAMVKTVKIAVKAPEAAPVEPVATLPSTSAAENQ